MLTYQRYECEVLTCVSLDLANRFARKLTKITGEEFRVQTEEEWEEAKDLLAGRHFTWTTTLAEPTKEQTKYVLRQLGSRLRYPLPSDYCSSLETAIRLVRESGG
jgi:formylglycine-generating enzyme required for sulfatase activity